VVEGEEEEAAAATAVTTVDHQLLPAVAAVAIHRPARLHFSTHQTVACGLFLWQSLLPRSLSPQSSWGHGGETPRAITLSTGPCSSA